MKIKTGLNSIPAMLAGTAWTKDIWQVGWEEYTSFLLDSQVVLMIGGILVYQTNRAFGSVQFDSHRRRFGDDAGNGHSLTCGMEAMRMHGQMSTGRGGIESGSSVAGASLVTRRTWLGLLAVPLHGARKKTVPRTSSAHTKQSPARVAGTVRERLWISAGGGDGVMTPAESALYLGTPNLILALPLKNRSFDRQLALSVSGFTQVVWAIDDLDLLTRSAPMLAEFPNFTGVLLNTPVQTDLQKIPNILGRRDIWMDVHQKGSPLQAGDARMQFNNVVVLWPGRDEPLESAFARWEKYGMDAGLTIGCSIQGNPPVEFLRHQCDLALKWMRTGLIGGLVFGAGPGIGHNSAPIDWARQWVSDVGGQLL